MNKNIIYSLLISFIGIMNLSAQNDDADNYWILDNFTQFESIADTLWVAGQAKYQTYPNNVDLTTYYANFEEPVGCATGAASLRIRGLANGGYATFTVDNAKYVTLSFTGKKANKDRTVRIYRNGSLIKEVLNIDKFDCLTYTDAVNSNEPLTYKITAGNEGSTDPIVLYAIEVVKYGSDIEPEPEPNTDGYWIYDDLSKQQVQDDYVESSEYKTLPNDIVISAVNSNIEFGEVCTQGTRTLRISGREGAAGHIQFSVPNANKVTIGVTGKASNADRELLVYRNDVLIKTFTKLDKITCEEFTDYVNSEEIQTYKIMGGNNEFKPVSLNYIYAEKYTATGVENVDQANGFAIYPNPASDVVYFGQEVVRADICDMNGRLVSTASNTKQMNITRLQEGFYIVKVITEKGSYSKKLVKVN